MATVRDLSGNTNAALGSDDELEKPNRNNAGSPVGSITPNYPGEIVLDTTNFLNWEAAGTANTDWVLADKPV